MSKIHALAVSALVVLLSAAVWFVLWSGGEHGADAGRSAVAEDEFGSAELTAAGGRPADGTSPARERLQVEAASLASEAAAPAAIVGRVVDATDRPVVGAKVVSTLNGWDFGDDEVGFADADRWTKRAEAAAKTRVETETDGDGRFALVPRGQSTDVQVRVLARGFRVHDASVRRPKEQNFDLGTVRLRAGGVVSGKVVDAAGKPLAGARVRAAGNGLPFSFVLFAGVEEAMDASGGGESARTDIDGRFELAHVEAGDLTLQARHPQHPATKLSGLRLAAGDVLRDVLVTMDPAAGITGKVVDLPASTDGLRVLARRFDDRDGDGFQFASMGRRLSEVVTDLDAGGAFSLVGLLAGAEYDVWVAQRVPTWPGVAPAGPSQRVRAGATGVELRFELGVKVVFNVVDARSGQPVERLWVDGSLRGGNDPFGGFVTRNNKPVEYAGGRVTIAGLRPGDKQTLNLRVDGIGYGRFQRDGIELPLAGEMDLGTIRLDPTPVVRVRVTAVADGAPVSGATVRLTEKKDAANGQIARFMAMQSGSDGPRTGKTDADGRCVLNAVPDADLQLTVDSKEFAPYRSETFKVDAAGGTRDVSLCVGGSVAVEVLDEHGEPLGKTTVAHAGPNDVQGSRDTDAQGRVLFDRLAPGEHRFRLRDRGQGTIQFGGFAMAISDPSDGKDKSAAEWEHVDVVDQVRSSVRLKKAPTAILTGIVRENGRPLAGAQVAFLRGSGDADSGGGLAMFFGGQDSASTRAKTDAEGRYTLEGLATGEHRLRVTHPERAMPAVVPAALAIGANVVDVDLDCTIVRGVVRAADGKPIAKATVRATGGGNGGGGPGLQVQFDVVRGVSLDGFGNFGGGGRNRVETDAAGHYELRGVTGGKPLVIEASADDFVAGRSTPVEVARGEVKSDVDVVLVAAGRLRVHAALDVGGAQVQAEFADRSLGVPGASARLAQGSAVLKNLRPGRWTLTVSARGRDRVSREVDVVAGKTVDVEF